VHVSSYYLQTSLQPGVPQIFGAAHKSGATTSLDTNWDPKEEWDAGIHAALAHTDLFLPNRAEALAVARAATLDKAVDDLAGAVRTVAVKLAADGAIAAHGAERIHVPGQTVDVIDTTGAGDSFDAGFVAATLWGWPLRSALAFAAACGALATRAAGGTGSQPTLEEAMDFSGVEMSATEVQG
jgi:sugar/nucleoside kinase (ribokinase family)